MGFAEWPLVFFTVIAQSTIGAYWWCLFNKLFAGGTPEQMLRLDHAMLAVWLLLIASFAIATLHLGSPRRAINAVFRVGRSAFSNEVFFGGGFAALGLLGWIVDWVGLDWLGTSGDWMIMSLTSLTFLFSLAFFASMIALYRIRTVPTWYNWMTPVAFTVTTLLGGSALASCLFAAAMPVQTGLSLFCPIGVMALSFVGSLFVTLKQAASLLEIETAIKRPTDLCPHFATWMAARFALLFAVLASWIWVLLTKDGLSLTVGLAGVVIVLIGEMIGRGIHYQLNMTVGLR
ncbi:DmsC/YnfH family molybdoenzyme membrane anchor subunit [uncultured Cohaesibacter sp.]|uniref:dimethyl sulfoxide reductase anchor subunit family protein n=1 Tax=uncultured Cohaesibacter sp. TaxID=1002546 RepID=UPI002931713E|nr:DmsC/YnfH family molybdoenzyme membrane anchor subunit [uncultured Cohaesibacter sp.]